MQCPECQELINPIQSRGNQFFYCRSCDWGDKPALHRRLFRPVLFWLLSILITFGFYALLRFGVPETGSLYNYFIDVPKNEYLSALHRNFLWIYLVYVSVGALLSKTPLGDIVADVEETTEEYTSWFAPGRDIGLIPVLFSFIPLFFFPGTIVFMTLRNTLRSVFNTLKGSK
jgi:hypothetical protein